MAEYLIQEESLVELADIVREKFAIYDDIIIRLTPQTGYPVYCYTMVIPDGTTNIGMHAFETCGYDKIIIPDSVTLISSQAFYRCNYLEDIYLNSTVPPNLKSASAFPSDLNLTIHVPIGSGEAYKSATNWSTFADKIVEDIVV